MESGDLKQPLEKLKFEEAMKRLEAIVADMETGQVDIEDAVAQYEDAMKLKAHCQNILDHAEQRIRKIQVDNSGQPRSEPFEFPRSAAPESPGAAE